MLFPFVESKPDKVAVLGFPRSTRLKDPLGPDIKVMFIPDLMKKITIKFSKIKVEEKAIPETYPLLRTIQFALDYGGYLKSKYVLNIFSLDNFNDFNKKFVVSCISGFQVCRFIFL